MICFRETKSGTTSEYHIGAKTVHKVEDSSQHFVLVASGRPTGAGFKSREESKLFLDSVDACVVS